MGVALPVTGIRDRGGRRVAITGLGAVTPVGASVAHTWTALVEARSGVKPIRRFDASSFPTTFGAEVDALDSSKLPADPAVRQLLDLKNLFGWVAAEEALADSGLLGKTDHARIGVSLGTEARRPDYVQRLAAGERYRDVDDHLRYAPFVLASVLASQFGLGGPQLIVSTACTSGTQAIGVAFHKVRAGDVDAMLAGGCDSLIDPLMLTGFSLLGALSTRNDDPAHASRPFDLMRDGFVLGEGAGMLVLEEWEHARARGASIHAEVVGYASSSNAYRITDSPPDGGGPAAAMAGALADAGLAPDAIDYVNAHGTSTAQNDRSETAAIKRTFGDHAYKLAISSTKSMVGHLVNAGGAMELVVCALTVKHDLIHPTINYCTEDPECDLDYVPNVARRARVDRALSNSFGFGGVNASVILEKGPR
jgi:3-oxoacyl-[acyl-carrier-protein] synthase II